MARAWNASGIPRSVRARPKPRPHAGRVPLLVARRAASSWHRSNPHLPRVVCFTAPQGPHVGSRSGLLLTLSAHESPAPTYFASDPGSSGSLISRSVLARCSEEGIVDRRRSLLLLDGPHAACSRGFAVRCALDRGTASSLALAQQVRTVGRASRHACGGLSDHR